jgi:hypothetical protein
MDALIGVLIVLFVGGVCSALSLPFILHGSRRAKTTGVSVRRALGYALAAWGVNTVLLGGAGFVFGAGIGDERAGEIAIMLFAVGVVFGFVFGGVVTFVLIVVAARRSRR